MGKVSAFLFLSVIAYATAVPWNTKYPVDKSTGYQYFWYKSDEGKVVKAFLEGGSPARVGKAIEDDVEFFLYTPRNPTTPQVLKPNCDSCLDNSNFNSAAPIKIICHGFMNSYESDINIVIRDAYLSLNTDVNIIKVNWESLAQPPFYDSAAANTKPVGLYAATLVDYLVSRQKTTYGNVHFIGHSLGSHVGGYLGSATAGKISRITALDPALPLFGAQGDEDRIDSTDADFVDVIHTAGGSLAFDEPRGHIDFYPNDGTSSQPGCGVDLISTCSHGRAYEFMAESIGNVNGFPAYKCNSWDSYADGSCSMTDRTYMGEAAGRNLRGNYYLRTNAIPPYGQE